MIDNKNISTDKDNKPWGVPLSVWEDFQNGCSTSQQLSVDEFENMIKYL